MLTMPSYCANEISVEQLAKIINGWNHT